MLPEQSELLHANAEQCSQFLKQLANSDRLLLLCQMLDGEKSVSELESLTQIHQPSLSQQLAVLRKEGLVETRKEGKQVFYRVGDKRVLAMMETLYELFCGAKA